MGSFFLTCSVSHMTLNYQNTSVQLIIPKYETEEYSSLSLKEHMRCICSNDGAQEFFSPFGFPIHGKYDDCGELENIQRDKNVEVLEEFFGITIEQIIANAGDDRDVPHETKNKEIFLKLGKTFFRTDVLEFMERGWKDINLNNPKQYSGDGYLKQFIDAVKSVPSAARLDELKEKIKNKTATEAEEDEFFGGRNTYSIFSQSYIKSSDNFFRLLPIDFDSQLDDIKKQYTWIRRFGNSMNRCIFPSDYGSQQDNFTEIYELNEFVNDLLIEDIRDNYETEDMEDMEDYLDPDKIQSIRRILKTHNRNKALNDLGI